MPDTTAIPYCDHGFSHYLWVEDKCLCLICERERLQAELDAVATEEWDKLMAKIERLKAENASLVKASVDYAAGSNNEVKRLRNALLRCQGAADGGARNTGGDPKQTFAYILDTCEQATNSPE